MNRFDDEKGALKVDTPGGIQKVRIVNEYCIYSPSYVDKTHLGQNLQIYMVIINESGLYR